MIVPTDTISRTYRPAARAGYISHAKKLWLNYLIMEIKQKRQGGKRVLTMGRALFIMLGGVCSIYTQIKGHIDFYINGAIWIRNIRRWPKTK